MKGLHKVTFILLVIGGLNWGLEVFNIGVGTFLPVMLAKVIYLLVGVSAIVEIVTHKSNCKNCACGCGGKDCAVCNPEHKPM